MEGPQIVYGEQRVYQYLPDTARIKSPCRHELYSDTSDEYIIKLLPEASEETKEKIRWLAAFRRKWERNQEYGHYVAAFPVEEVFSGCERRPEQWVGYAMKKCNDVHFELISSRPTAFRQEFGNSYTHLLGICMHLCSCADFLQRRGMRLSDIKPNNFFVRSDCLVYPIDTDGFSVHLKKKDGGAFWTESQIPLPIYHPNGKERGVPGSRYAQSWKTECYAIAMLLLQVLTSRDFSPNRFKELKKLRKYNLTMNPKEALRFDETTISKNRLMFYKLWYAMPQDFRDIFLNLIYGNVAYRLPTAGGWAYKISDYLNYLISVEKDWPVPPETLEIATYCSTWNPNEVPVHWNRWAPLKADNARKKRLAEQSGQPEQQDDSQDFRQRYDSLKADYEALKADYEVLKKTQLADRGLWYSEKEL